MSTKESKPNDEKQSADKQAQPVDKVAATYAATEKSLADIETKAVAARREVRELSEGYARAQEERQRANAQWDYEEEQRRRAVVDRQKEEDRKRELAHDEREVKIKERETTVNTTLAKLLGIASDPFNPEVAKSAFDKKLKEAEDNGKNADMGLNAMNDMLLQDGDVILPPQDGTPGSSWFVWSESRKAYGMRWVPEAEPSNESTHGIVTSSIETSG